MPSWLEHYAIYSAEELSLSPEEQEQQLAELRKIPRPYMAPSTAAELERAEKRFRGLVAYVWPHLDGDALFYTPGAPLPLLEHMGKYAGFLARFTSGALEQNANFRTVIHYMNLTLSTIQTACGHQPAQMSPIRNHVKDYITGILVEKMGLSTSIPTKGVVHAEDLTFILQKLHKPEYLNTFDNMRTLLNLTLFISLMVDLCARDGEIARKHGNPKHMCLRWEDIEFYSHQCDEDYKFDIRALIHVRWSEASTPLNPKPKAIPFPGLLPNSMALHDTLRLILNLALLDGLFGRRVKSWSDLHRLRYPRKYTEHGVPIATKSNMKTIPVLRRMSNYQLTDEPVNTSDMKREMNRLGIFCGLRGRLTPNCIRRGVAHTLEENTSIETENFLMDYAEEADSFSSYQSPISTFDIPSVYRNFPQRNVIRMTEISYGRSGNAPVGLSEAGEQKVMRRDDVQASEDPLGQVH